MTTSLSALAGSLTALAGPSADEPVGADGSVPLEDLPLAADGQRVMHLLERGVPLTLLIDLLTPYGPDSADILATETGTGR